MRLFLAVFPPAAVQRAAHAASEALRRPGDSVSWVKPDNLHYTLRFLGELGEEGARRAGEAAAEAAATERAFEATLGGLGAFPDARRARVIWMGMTAGAEPLERLARTLEGALRKRGFDPADRPFSAHLTLGRVRTPGSDWTPRLAAARVEPSRFVVDRMVVVQSQLTPKGSNYTVRSEAALGA
jgi:2'-5' RNA ligase